MKKNSSNQEIDALVSDFTNNLTLVLRRSALEEVLAALGNGAAPKTGRRRGRPVGSKNKASTTHDQMGERLLSHVKSNAGQRGDQIAKALRTDVHTMRPAMKKLIAAKKVKTKGQRRGMTYHAA
jgi:hypothetical protein